MPSIFEQALINQQTRYKKLRQEIDFKIKDHKYSKELWEQSEELIQDLKNRKDFLCSRCKKNKTINLNDNELPLDYVYLCHEGGIVPQSGCPHYFPLPFLRAISYCQSCSNLPNSTHRDQNFISRIQETQKDEAPRPWFQNEIEKRKRIYLKKLVEDKYKIETDSQNMTWITVLYEGETYARPIRPETVSFIRGDKVQWRQMLNVAFEEIVNAIILKDKNE